MLCRRIICILEKDNSTICIVIIIPDITINFYFILCNKSNFTYYAIIDEDLNFLTKTKERKVKKNNQISQRDVIVE